ncbi:MAG TPA: RNB domain-containing ribonuclease [Actinomycetes bacterium]|nr:RNB domain-containing ribonuclease [Actinomycetes bacterium]
MPRRHLALRVRDEAGGRELRAGFARIRDELDLAADFPADVLAEAEESAREARLPAEDLTDLPFLTIDPPGSEDLDQAMHLERRAGGYRLRYAIADVGTYVRPGGAVDAEAHRRGETHYSPDTRTPLHPPVLSEGAASLLPGEVRAAVLWTIDLDPQGEQTAVEVRRARVRSRDRLDYAAVQDLVDSGRADERLQLLAQVGKLRMALEVERGGVSLPIPEQEVVEDGGRYRLEYRTTLPVESWNEQVSLLTGMAAADLMLHGEIGVLRTLPQASNESLEQLRRAARALGVDWPRDRSYAEVVHDLDPANPRHAALLEEATSLLRGAGYTAFDGGVPEHATHAAVAAEYAHATAPLRRLVDRYVSEVCLALCAGDEVPGFVRSALPGLPSTMSESGRVGHELERECVALMEAAVLHGREGEEFDAVVVEVSRDGASGTVQLADPAVRATCEGRLPVGEAVRVRLAEADVQRRSVRFALV